jgi:hypothetical protein
MRARTHMEWFQKQIFFTILLKKITIISNDNKIGFNTERIPIARVI